MLNTLVNSTGEGLCNQTSTYYKQSCIDEIFECIGTVQCQTDMNTEALEQIHDSLQTTEVDATNVLANSICSSSICTNAISSVGIEANNMQSQCLNVDGKATVGSLEANGVIKAESVETQSLSTENITGLQSLTVEGGVWADDVRTDSLEVNGKAVAECIESDEISTESLKSDAISTSTIGADTVVSDCFMGTNANIQKACVGSLSTSCFSSDEISTSKINSTSLSVPKVETSGGITGKGTIDTTSPVWKEIKIPLFTGTVQFYTDEWKVTINGGREFIWEDPSLDHLKFLSNDGETITVAVDWDGEVFYTYNVAKEEPILSFADNTGHTPDDDHTYIMQDSGIPRGTVYIYQDKEFTNQGLTILGKVRASNLEITCSETIGCLCVGNLCVTNSITSDSPIEVNICARNFCVSSPCTYIDNCLYADHLETHCICNDGYLHTDRLYFDTIQMVNCTESPKQVVVYKDGLLCDSYKVCVDDDTVYSKKSCACDFYGNLHGKANDTCCFDGRVFCDACLEILSGKACTAELADNSCCFEGRTFCKACLEILSGKACTAGMADCAKNVCIWCLWAGEEAEWGYIPFVEPYTGCLVQARMDTGYGNPIVAYNEYGLVCLEIRGCVCVRDDPLIANSSIATRYLKADDLRVCDDALITSLCTCEEYTKRLDVSQCAKFHGPTYFYDNIYQCGQAYCTHAQNIYTCSDTITMREGAGFAGKAQIKVLKYDGTNNGIIQLGTDGTLRIGDETNCQPVLTRSEEDDICDGHVLIWDATARCAKDGGDAIVTCEYVHCVGKECAKASCAYAVSCAHDVGGAACTYAHSVGYECKNAACSFAVSCGHAIGTSCKNAATSTKANCYGKSYNCVQCSEWARRVCLEAFDAVSKKFIYIGMPGTEKNIGCNPNLWFCPSCNIMAIGSTNGSAICLVGAGSCCMSGICTKLNPKVVFASTDNQCGCLQYSQYDGVHPGAGLCWQTNTTNSWFQTDCIYANKYLDENGCQLGAYCATISSPIGTTKYVLLDLGSVETSVQFNTLNNSGTITRVEATGIVGHVIALNSSGITGWDSIEAPSHCFWLRVKAPVKLWGRYPINVVYNTTTDPGCTWKNLTILPTCSYVSTVGTQCKDASCSFAVSCGHDIGTSCKNDACAFAVSCGHAIGTACKNASTATKANCYGKSYNCVQCADLARKAILGAYTAPQKRFVYFGNPAADTTPIGCNPNLWYCPTCSILAMTGSDNTGSTLCLVGKGSCYMGGICSKENPKIVFADTAGYCGCLQLSRYTDTVHPGYGLCWMTNYPQDSWFQTDCFYAKCYLDSNGNCLAGYTATVDSPAGNTRYVLLDLGKEDTMVDFQIYNSHGTIVKSTSESEPAGTIYQSNSYGINGYRMVDARGSCVWLRLIGWRALNLWGSYPIKVVTNTTTNPGCTWNSPTILPNCDYVSTVGTQCKSAACTYANTVAFCNVNTCSGLKTFGVARGVNGQCWTKPGHWAYMTTNDGPNCCWNHVIKTDWNAGVDVWSSGISIPTYNAPQNGIHYKVGCCGGKTGWTLIPDITCVQNTGLACRNLAEACACAFTASCGHEIGTSCKDAATAKKANCYGNSRNCVQCSELARKVDLETYNALGQRPIYFGRPDATKNIGCNPNLWFCPTCNIMTMGDANGTALCLIGKGSCCMGGICSKLNPKIVFASTDNQCGCLQYSQYDGVHPGAGLCWQTNTTNSWFQTDCVYANKYLDASGVALPTCTYVSTVGDKCKSAACSFAVSCGHEIGTSCRNLAEACACAFAATCAQSVVPETSTFAKCYGNSTNCVAYANQVRVGVGSGNTFYKMPFTGSTGTTTSNQSLYIDNANAYPTYNPSTNVFCGYTVCVAQTLAVRNANGGFRLGNYCIYIA